MLIIVGLVILLAAVVVGIAGVVTNAGAAHLLTDDFAVLGYHVTGSTGTVFLYGIVVGAVAGVGLSVLLVGARRAVNRGHAAQLEFAQAQPASAAVKVHGDHGVRPGRDRHLDGPPGRWASLTERWSRWLIGGDNHRHAATRRPTASVTPPEATTRSARDATPSRPTNPSNTRPTATAPAITPLGPTAKTPQAEAPTSKPPATTSPGGKPPGTTPTSATPSHH